MSRGTIVVTGGNGFIGAAVAARLRAAGHPVSRMDIAGDQAGDAGCVRGDVTRPEDCERCIGTADVVIHGAGMHHVNEVAAAPERMRAVNVTGTEHVLRSAVAARARRVVFLSTGKVYGEPDVLPSDEDHETRPLEAYAHAKIEAERQCRLVQEQAGLELVVIRPFSVYGPGQNLDTGYIGMLIRALRDETPLALPGNPDAVRDFVHIDDVTRLCALAATAPVPGYSVLNAGSGRATSLRDLVALAARLTGRRLVPHWTEPKGITIRRTHAGMASAERLLGFRPAIDLAEGLSDTLAWFLGSTVNRRAPQ